MNHGILVVATDRISRLAFERVLTDHGHEPTFADTAEQAVAATNAEGLRLTVIDMPGSTIQIANQLAEDLLATNREGRLIIIHDPQDPLHTAADETNRIQYLQRPFSMLEFIANVDHALAVGL